MAIIKLTSDITKIKVSKVSLRVAEAGSSEDGVTVKWFIVCRREMKWGTKE